MKENWKSYFCNVNGKLASIALNLGLGEDAPLREKPWLLWVWVYLRQPRPDGLSDRSEFDTICAIEDELAKKLSSGCQAVEAGRITTDGRREFYFYGTDEKGFKKAVRAAMGGFREYKFDMGTQEELDWNQYRNVLFPSEEDMQRIANRDVLDTLEQHGDTLEAVRDVHHWIYFRRCEDRERYAARVLELGYTVEDQTEDLEQDRPYGLSITRDQSVTPEKINEAVLELFRMAKEADAEYDGWEAQVIAIKN